jgi:peptide/nickel transport system substrate-binding protein
MKMKILAIVMMLSIALMLIIPAISSVGAVGVPNPNTVTFTTIGGPDAAWGTDPSGSYDTASSTMQQQVLEPLFMYNNTNTTAYVPMLADYWPGYGVNPGNVITPEGPVPGVSPKGTAQTYRFHIRENVKWQDNQSGTDVYVTPQDVVYSIERGLLQDSTTTVQWLLYTPLTGAVTGHATDPMFTNTTTGKASVSDATTFKELLLAWVEGAVQCNATWVWFNLPTPYGPFMQILTQSWAFVQCKKWDIAQGCWNVGAYVTSPVSGPAAWHFAGDTGILHFTGDDNFTEFTRCYQPSISPLMAPSLISSSEPMMGSGPYRLSKFNPDPHVGFQAFTKFDDYWDAAAVKTEYVTIKLVEEWSNRKAQFLSTNPALQCDLTYVPRPNAPELSSTGQIGKNTIPGVSLTTFSAQEADYLFFNYNVSVATGYMPALGGKPNATLFSDRDLRLAFIYAFNESEFLTDVFFNLAIDPTSYMCEGTAYYNTSTAFLRNIDLIKAQDYLDLAWGGQAKAKGISVSLVYDTGDVERQTCASMLADVLTNRLTWGVKPTISVVGIPWSTFLDDMFYTQLPVFVVGWLADYPDPSDWAGPFLSPEGAYSGPCQAITYGMNATSFNADWVSPATYPHPPYTNALKEYVTGINDTYVDHIIMEALMANSTVRSELYNEMMDIFYAEAGTIPLVQPEAMHFERTWVHGWIGGYSNNPIAVGPYFAQIYKALPTPTTNVYEVDLDALHSVVNTSVVYTYMTVAITPSVSNYTGDMEWQEALAYIDFTFTVDYLSCINVSTGLPITPLPAITVEVSVWRDNASNWYSNSTTFSSWFSIAGGVNPLDLMFNESATAVNGTWNIAFTAVPTGVAGAVLTPKNVTTLMTSRSLFTVILRWPGDANGDGTVDLSDFGIMQHTWGFSTGDKNFDPRADFNQDGTIDLSDFGIMQYWWGYTFAPP